MDISATVDKLFEELKNCSIYTTIKTGRVKIRTGATYGDWATIGRMIDPKHPRPIELAEDFMYNNRKAAKELRDRIAQWRKDNTPPAKIKVLCIEEDCFYDEDLPAPVTAEGILAWFIESQEDPDDWSVMDDKTIAGMRVVQIGENVEGYTRKFMWVPE